MKILLCHQNKISFVLVWTRTKYFTSLKRKIKDGVKMLGLLSWFISKIKEITAIVFYQVYYFPALHSKMHKPDDLKKEQKFYSTIDARLNLKSVKGHPHFLLLKSQDSLFSVSLPASASYWLFLAFLLRHSPLPWGHMAHVSLFVICICVQISVFI